MRSDSRARSSDSSRPAVNASGGRKFDGAKPRLELLPFDALVEVAKVLTVGAAKYGDHNWRLVERFRYEGAMLRHYSAIQSGEATDPETGLPHAAHLACNALFILALLKEGK